MEFYYFLTKYSKYQFFLELSDIKFVNIADFIDFYYELTLPRLQNDCKF